MAIPVINTTTSVQGWKQWQYWEYQPYASNSPTSWACPNLPAGLTIDTPTQYAVTGVEATDVITATGNNFVDGMAVVIPSLTGGAGLSANTIYYVRDRATHTFKLAATAGGAAINFTTDISAGSISRLPTGKISGASEVAGTFNCGLTATNGDGDSVPLPLSIGIEESSAALTTSGYEVKIDVVTRQVSLVGGGELNIFAKNNDDLLLFIKFEKDGQALDLDIQTLLIALKENDTDPRIVLGEDWKKFGSGTGAYYALYASISGSRLRAALSNYEADKGTSFDALSEIEWQEANPDYGSGFGPENFRFTTRDFATTVGSEKAQAA